MAVGPDAAVWHQNRRVPKPDEGHGFIMNKLRLEKLQEAQRKSEKLKKEIAESKKRTGNSERISKLEVALAKLQARNPNLDEEILNAEDELAVQAAAMEGVELLSSGVTKGSSLTSEKVNLSRNGNHITRIVTMHAASKATEQDIKDNLEKLAHSLQHGECIDIYADLNLNLLDPTNRQFLFDTLNRLGLSIRIDFNDVGQAFSKERGEVADSEQWAKCKKPDIYIKDLVFTVVKERGVDESDEALHQNIHVFGEDGTGGVLEQFIDTRAPRNKTTGQREIAHVFCDPNESDVSKIQVLDHSPLTRVYTDEKGNKVQYVCANVLDPEVKSADPAIAALLASGTEEDMAAYNAYRLAVNTLGSQHLNYTLTTLIQPETYTTTAEANKGKIPDGAYMPSYDEATKSDWSEWSPTRAYLTDKFILSAAKRKHDEMGEDEYKSWLKLQVAAYIEALTTENPSAFGTILEVQKITVPESEGGLGLTVEAAREQLIAEMTSAIAMKAYMGKSGQPRPDKIGNLFQGKHTFKKDPSNPDEAGVTIHFSQQLFNGFVPHPQLTTDRVIQQQVEAIKKALIPAVPVCIANFMEADLTQEATHLELVGKLVEAMEDHNKKCQPRFPFFANFRDFRTDPSTKIVRGLANGSNILLSPLHYFQRKPGTHLGDVHEHQFLGAMEPKSYVRGLFHALCFVPGVIFGSLLRVSALLGSYFTSGDYYHHLGCSQVHSRFEQAPNLDDIQISIGEGSRFSYAIPDERRHSQDPRTFTPGQQKHPVDEDKDDGTLTVERMTTPIMSNTRDSLTLKRS